MRSKIVLLLALIMGIITTVLFFQYIREAGQAQEVIQQEVEMAEVIVAVQTINENHTLTEELLGVKKVPKESMHPNTVTDMDEVIGKFTTSMIETGETLLTHRVKSDEEEKQFISRKVSDGNRAVSIEVNFVRSVSNLIEPEDYVDVILTEDIEDEIVSIIIQSKIRVLAVGRKMNPPTAEEGHVEYSSLTLELSAADATSIVNASHRGTLHFILHSSINREDDLE
ncbi:MAG: Flp pilus assembly protein CpaB [Bacillus sp. (in: Bacteria)]|nr:Flp pilus assembly protein CpaB [Bacillus sp. (in: firmicutes)]